MGKSLVIVESPSKASIINRYLGDEYVVKASVGHIRDLASVTPPKAKDTDKKAKLSKDESLAMTMGVNPKKHWQANYEIMPDKQKVVSELKKLSKEADKVYLATDLDREGEAIAWHLKEVLGGSDDKYFRVKYPEITKAAIDKAFENPGPINMNLVNAQQTRRFLDRVVGFMVSPLLWKKVARGLSAGRVQSVAVELIVDKEREIKAFIPEEYWSIDALLNNSKGESTEFALTHKNGTKISIADKDAAQKAVDELSKSQFVVSKVERRNGTQHALPPFTTSTLQQVANQRLGFSVRRTMTVAQHLYEQGLITYMRTDSVNLSDEAIAAARSIIEDNFGKKYLPSKPNFYKSKESAQEAHEAIRPSHPLDPLPANVDRDGQRLFELIKARYLACQMAPQEYETTSVTVKAGDYDLKASGKHVLFDGFKKVYNFNRNEEVLLPEFNENEKLSLEKLNPQQHFTQPPARYSEATLVKELEKDGIGRPSTYASIISTIQERGYVKIVSGRFFAERMGEVVTDRLRFSFKDLMDKNFTASMENDLDDIADGKKDWIESLDAFYKDFEVELQSAQKSAADGGMPENHPLEIKELMCPECGRYHMAVQSGKTGMFLSCLGYYDKDVKTADRCHKTLNLRSMGIAELSKSDLTDEEEAQILRSRPRCPVCHSVMDTYIIDEGHKLHLCSTPNC
ncbi:MAG: type I DNA topoisomerase, partial [Succinivibrio sp.]